MKVKAPLASLFVLVFIFAFSFWGCASAAPATATEQTYLTETSEATLNPPPGEEWSEQKWREERAKGVGGSDIPAITGRSPYASAFSKWAEKLGLYEPKPTPSMERGTALEPVAREMYEKQKEKKVSAFPPASFFQSKQKPIFRAQADGLLVNEKIIVEIKTTTNDERWEGDAVPKDINDQIQWQMGVLGLEWKTADVAVLFCGWEIDKQGGEFFVNPLLAAREFCKETLKIYSVNRDYQHIEKLQKAASEFWRKVEAKEPIEPPDSYLGSVGKGSALLNTRDALTAVYLQGLKNETKNANEKARNIIARLEELNNKSKDWEPLRNKLRFEIGVSGARSIQSGNIVYTWHNSGRLTKKTVKQKK